MGRTFRMAASAVLLLISGASQAAAQAPAPSVPRSLGFQITHVDTGEPYPSPDGKKILYVSMIEEKYQIFTMNRDGSEPRQITHDGFSHDSPSWSPDGKKIAYVSDRTGHEVIYTINADGTGEERLTPENADSIHPAWSPDGTKVIYCADDDLHPPKKNASEVSLVDVKTKQVATVISGGTNTYPSYSPDGKKVVFRRMIGDMNSEVFVANADGSDAKNVSNHMAFDGWPAWSPDGTKIAFASNRLANYQIWVMNADGTEPSLLANTEGRATEPRWSVDGKMIYFTNCRKVDFGVDCQVMGARTV